MRRRERSSWIEFRDWTFVGDRYRHGFGRFPQNIQLATFEQIWQRMNLAGAPPICQPIR